MDYGKVVNLQGFHFNLKFFSLEAVKNDSMYFVQRVSALFLATNCTN